MYNMKGMRVLFVILAVVFLATAGPLDAFGREAQKNAGITAIFNFDKGFVFLNLVDMKTRGTIEKARVEARVTGPDGKKLKSVQLAGMVMNGDYVYMNSAPLEAKVSGEHRFDISVAAGKRKANFKFKAVASAGAAHDEPDLKGASSSTKTRPETPKMPPKPR